MARSDPRTVPSESYFHLRSRTIGGWVLNWLLIVACALAIANILLPWEISGFDGGIIYKRNFTAYFILPVIVACLLLLWYRLWRGASSKWFYWSLGAAAIPLIMYVGVWGIPLPWPDWNDEIRRYPLLWFTVAKPDQWPMAFPEAAWSMAFSFAALWLWAIAWVLSAIGRWRQRVNQQATV